MKKSSLCLGFCVVSVLSALGANPQTLITFDDISIPSLGAPVPGGYAGFQWGFGILDPQALPLRDQIGYLNGMVSPRHVAFNEFASLTGTVSGGFRSSGSLFDFNSAYLTAAWNDGLQVDVLGFAGGWLTHSNHFTLDTSAPTLLNFDYLGIDAVDFVSYGGIPHGNPSGGGTQIAIDNLVVTFPVPEPNTVSFLLLGACLIGYGLAKRGF
jgi:hypothetical protein